MVWTIRWILVNLMIWRPENNKWNWGEKLDKDISSVQFSRSAVSDSLRPHESQACQASLYHQLPKFTQTHVHQVSDAIQPPHPLLSPSPPAPKPSQHTFSYIVFPEKIGWIYLVALSLFLQVYLTCLLDVKLFFRVHPWCFVEFSSCLNQSSDNRYAGFRFRAADFRVLCLFPWASWLVA